MGLFHKSFKMLPGDKICTFWHQRLAKSSKFYAQWYFEKECQKVLFHFFFHDAAFFAGSTYKKE